jgi:prefoldin subunit 5
MSIPASAENTMNYLKDRKQELSHEKDDVKNTSENKTFQINPKELLEALKHKTQECAHLREELDKCKEYIKLLVENIRKRG